MTEPMIVVRNLCYTYQSGAVPKQALIDINLEIARGGCAAVIGVTGSGKSTLVQHFNGLLHPTSGGVIVNGIDVNAKGADLRTLRQRVGMLFQYPEAQLFAHTVYADVAFGPQRMKLNRHETRLRVLKALETVGLPPRIYAARSPFELSGGQMRRVALAGVLAMTPSTLILDEPTTGLDAGGRAEFYYYLRRVQQEQGVTIVLVSHDMAEVAELADRLFVLSEGQLVMQGSPRAIFNQGETLRACGLAVPPLSELLSLLRRQGMPIPDNVFTLDEAFDAIQNSVEASLPGKQIMASHEKEGLTCHSERSEESGPSSDRAGSREILRCAQNDIREGVFHSLPHSGERGVGATGGAELTPYGSEGS